MRKFLTVLIAAFALTALAPPAFADGSYEEEPDFCDPSNKPGGVALSVWLEQNGNPDCIDLAVVPACGTITGTITREDTPEAWNWAVAFEEGAATYNLSNATFGSRSFAEDYNGGSVTVSYYLVGPESDYGKISGEPNFWSQNAATVEIDTDCEEPPVVPDVEVCRDDKIITIPADEVLETDDRIFTDSQRDNCKPPRVPPVVTPEPGPVVQFPPYSVGYACPGTDGVIVELPWGTYEDMYPTPELAKLYGCPVVEEIPVVLIAPTSTVLTELPFTGPSDSLPFLALAGLAALGMGGVLVRSARADG